MQETIVGPIRKNFHSGPQRYKSLKFAMGTAVVPPPPTTQLSVFVATVLLSCKLQLHPTQNVSRNRRIGKPSETEGGRPDRKLLKIRSSEGKNQTTRNKSSLNTSAKFEIDKKRIHCPLSLISLAQQKTTRGDFSLFF